MIVREIDPSHSAVFFELQKKSNEVYSSQKWVDAYPLGIKLFGIFSEANVLLGGLVAFERVKAGIKMLITPPFASHVGWFFYSEKIASAKIHSDRKAAIQALSDYLNASDYHYYKLEFADELVDTQPFIWSKNQVEIRYTYVLNITRTVEELVENLDPKLRNKIHKTSTSAEVSHIPNLENAYALFSSTLNRSGVKRDDAVLKSVMNSDALLPTFIVLENRPVALAMIAGQGNKCYYLFGAADREVKENSIGPKAIWNAILLAKKMGFHYFDFEGSMVPEIEAYFRQFGGELKPLYTIKGGRGLWPRLIQWYLS